MNTLATVALGLGGAYLLYRFTQNGGMGVPIDDGGTSVTDRVHAANVNANPDAVTPGMTPTQSVPTFNDSIQPTSVRADGTNVYVIPSNPSPTLSSANGSYANATPAVGRRILPVTDRSAGFDVPMSRTVRRSGAIS